MSSDESSDEDFETQKYSDQEVNMEDLSDFKENYEKLKKKYITRPVLTKYEKTQIISERSQQLTNGAISFLKNPESYNSPYEIALEELKQKKIPFIIKRPIANTFEYWKLEDLKII